ncbi:hypothetical protein TVAG_496800 [Trichomonas vaginalis G3]|uniref:Glycosyltransferase 61 catalytic domain-containing protein n=1 Tax=Trichomonas vaginalis (strain ATCC PRA-98 / G3) TaxID=412133 RepID=A2FP17_TRIV3|nr:glycosyltransferase family [Trichomonas vaginalis G3]EAX93358.1 hypothetical protein TVAG_496800 [Trichomonas vaginalis G3]KAI5517999.1 glycosyltransferase family [Trichomonas vaginalis G3]|eukprot:XP_001306288.1 hypothetical protein [Trichomonas vaginalis G3]
MNVLRERLMFLCSRQKRMIAVIFLIAISVVASLIIYIPKYLKYLDSQCYIPIFNTTIKISRHLPSSYLIKSQKILEYYHIDPNNLIIDELSRKSYDDSGVVSYNTHDKVINYAQKLSTTYAVLQNKYVNSWSLICDGKYIYIMEDYWAYRYDLKQYQHTLVGTYENVIAIGDRHADEYGHFFIDVLAPLMCIPRDIWKYSKIVVKGNNPYCTELLLSLNFTVSQILYLKEGEWILAKNLHTTLYPPSYFRHPGTAYRNLSIYLKQAFGVYDIKPTRYVLMNRDKNQKRRISNLDGIKTMLSVLYPDILWGDLRDLYPDIRSSAVSYASIKFLFGITGSNLIRTFFMHPKTVVVSCQLDFNDFNMQSIALVNEVMYFTFSTRGYNHYTYLPIYLHVEDALRAIKIGMYAAEHGKFPTNSTEYPYLR